MKTYTIALAGNPNVGKSTVFNALTGLRQHTGNWPGKTVAFAEGTASHNGKTFKIVDLPGTYSLMENSAEEEIAREFICSEAPDVVVVLCDATCMERNLILALQTIEAAKRTIVCVNLIDEARKKKIHIDYKRLANELGVPVVCTAARNKKGLDDLLRAIAKACENDIPSMSYVNPRELFNDDNISTFIHKAEDIYKSCVSNRNPSYAETDRKIDRILTSKRYGFPIMIALLFFIFWITLSGANYPSELLAEGLGELGDILSRFFITLGAPEILRGLFIDGVYRVLSWVVSVMLPPMAIFFPLFTLLEDLGYLPRVAFNLDKQFRRCCACGKQSLTMCMGFGCNAAGIIGCRIIDSPREKLIAIITNNFVPCNGRFAPPSKGQLFTGLCAF